MRKTVIEMVKAAVKATIVVQAAPPNLYKSSRSRKFVQTFSLPVIKK